MAADAADIEQWDRYWAFGGLHSFSQVASGNYQGAIADFWRERFAELAADMQVIDIATGNGAVALLALEAADEAGIEIGIDGVDLASIDPLNNVEDAALHESLRRIRFHPRTSAGNLPFEDDSVDLVCSQYGLEYGDLPTSVREIGRVCRSDATVALVLHHEGSLPLQATATEIAQLDFVLDETKLWLHARNVLRAMAERKGSTSAKIERKQRALNEALQRIQQQARASSSPRMLLGPTNYIREILSMVGRVSFSKLLDLLEETRQRVLANRQRLIDMQRAACSESDLRDLQLLLEEQGFVTSVSGPLREHDGGLLGWYLVAERQGKDPGPGNW